MKADTLSHHPDFDTGNPENEHLIVLPLDRFKGMPKSVAKTLGTQSNSTSEISLAVAGSEDGTIEEDNLNARVKLYQDEHYQSLLTWKDTHGLCLDGQNHLWKGDTLVIVENNDLRRGVLHHFHFENRQTSRNHKNHPANPAPLLVAPHERLRYHLCERMRNLPNEQDKHSSNPTTSLPYHQQQQPPLPNDHSRLHHKVALVLQK